MSKKEDAAYKEWLDEIRSGLPDEVKTHFDTVVSHGETGKEIFRGGIRENFLYSKLNEHKAEVDKFNDAVKRQSEWFEAEKPKNQNLMSEVQRLKQDLIDHKKKLLEAGIEVPDELKAALANANRANTVDNNELEQLKQKMLVLDRALPNVIGRAMSIATRVVQGKFDIDPAAVFALAAEKGMDLDRAFDELTKDERDKRSQKSLDERLKQAKEEGAREALSKLSGPDRAVRASGPSVVDSLHSPDKAVVITDRNDRINAAARGYAEALNSAGNNN